MQIAPQFIIQSKISASMYVNFMYVVVHIYFQQNVIIKKKSILY